MVSTTKRSNARHREAQDFLECVRDAIGRRLVSVLPDADEIAGHLGVSPESMRNRLQKQGTSLEQITAQVLSETEKHLQ